MTSSLFGVPDLPPQQYGHSSAIMNTVQQPAGAAGIAVMIAAMTIGAGSAAANGQGTAAAQATGTTAAFVVGGILALVAAVCAPFVRGSHKAKPAQPAAAAEAAKVDTLPAVT